MKLSASISVLALALTASPAPANEARADPPYVTRCEQGRVVEETHREDFPWIKQLVRWLMILSDEVRVLT